MEAHLKSLGYSRYWGVLIILGILLYACTKEEIEPEDCPPPCTVEPHVSFDPMAVPYDSLSTYSFFMGEMKNQLPDTGVVPFEPISTLFTDYAHKHRFIWMPDSVSATYATDNKILDFPDGTVLIKTFYYDHVQPEDETKIIETRLIYKVAGLWEFAN